MLRIEMYHKAGSLPTFTRIKESLQKAHYINGAKINEHLLEETNPYLGEQEGQIYLEATRENGADPQEGLIFLTDPEFEQENPQYPVGFNTKEVSITRPTVAEDVVKLVTSFDKSHSTPNYRQD